MNAGRRNDSPRPGSASRVAARVAATPGPARDPSCVTVADLGRIDQISALLSTLNDPSAGADALARHVQAIPVLRERVARRFARRTTGHGAKADVAAQIALLGNRVLEGVLLELLEDIVALHSEQSEPPSGQR
jgi:hypothetical protein